MGCSGDEGGQSTSTGSGVGGAGGAAVSGAGGAGGAPGMGGAPGTGGSTSTTTSTGTSMGSPCTGTTCDITVVGAGFNVDEGKTIYAGIVPQGGKGQDWSASDMITAGAFTMQGMGALKKGQAYNLNYYVDLNGNNACDPTPTDEVWRLSIPPVQEHLTITLPYNTSFSNIGCGGFP